MLVGGDQVGCQFLLVHGSKRGVQDECQIKIACGTRTLVGVTSFDITATKVVGEAVLERGNDPLHDAVGKNTPGGLDQGLGCHLHSLYSGISRAYGMCQAKAEQPAAELRRTY